MGCLRGLVRIDRSLATGDSNSLRRSLRAGVSALGGTQPAPRGGPPLHEVDEPAVRNPDAAHSRRGRSLRADRSGRTNTALRATRSLRINLRRRALQPRREARRSQRPPVAVPRAGVPLTAQLTHSPVDTGVVSPMCESWAATSLAVSTNPVSLSSTAAPNTTPIT